MTERRALKIAMSLLAAAVALAVPMRRALHSWGATNDDLNRAHPGDEILPGPVSCTTYAVSVAASAEQVWPWLVQMGQDRGGMYSYERLENLFGLDIHNSRHIRSEWQHLAPGDQVRVVPAGRLGMPDGYAFRVALVDPPRALVLRQQPPEHPWNATWAFLIQADGPRRCRLLARSRSARSAGRQGVLARAAEHLMQPVVFVMTRKMLIGIKERAEQLAADTSSV